MKSKNSKHALKVQKQTILNVEGLADFFRGLSFDHVSYGLASEVQERLNIQIVGGENEFEEGGLVYVAKIFVPRDDIVSLLFVFGVRLWCWVFNVVLKRH